MVLSLLFVLVSGFAVSQSLTGAWVAEDAAQRRTVIFTDKHYAMVIGELPGNGYKGTMGGSYVIRKNAIAATEEFNTMDPVKIGTEQSWGYELSSDKLVIHDGAVNYTFRRMDDGTPGALAGAWLITGRMTDTGMTTITPGARKTMKILSGTRFQWIAYNSETKEFFGTGAGTYTTKDGVYTETIEYFSRDASRVGASLTFSFALEEGHWRHRGKSSKGDPIDERWSRR